MTNEESLSNLQNKLINMGYSDIKLYNPLFIPLEEYQTQVINLIQAVLDGNTKTFTKFGDSTYEQ